MKAGQSSRPSGDGVVSRAVSLDGPVVGVQAVSKSKEDAPEQVPQAKKDEDDDRDNRGNKPHHVEKL